MFRPGGQLLPSARCPRSSGNGTFTAAWDSITIGPTDESCATMIDLQGAGDGTFSLRYYNP